MFNKLFKKIKEEKVYSPISGEVIEIGDVNDDTFSQKMLGDGFAVIPKEDVIEVVAPVNGTIVSIFPTKHAIGILSENKNELLYHFGIDTVAHNGVGIECHVKEGNAVKIGDKLLTIDLSYYIQQNVDVTNMLLITNLEDRRISKIASGYKKVGEEIMEIPS